MAFVRGGAMAGWLGRVLCRGGGRLLAGAVRSASKLAAYVTGLAGTDDTEVVPPWEAVWADLSGAS